MNSSRTLSGADLALQATGALCSSRVWSASRVATLPSFFRAGRRLYRSWTAHQCWCSISTVDSFSFLILAFACHAYPAFVLHLRFHQKPQSLFVRFRPCCSPFGRALITGSPYSTCFFTVHCGIITSLDLAIHNCIYRMRASGSCRGLFHAKR